MVSEATEFEQDIPGDAAQVIVVHADNIEVSDKHI
jgi:hypothetical protein